jgi:hypothetical protein
MILFGSSLQIEPLLALLELGAVAAALEHRRSPHGLLWPVVAGLLAGLAIETRELGVAVILPVAWLVWTTPASRDARRRWTRQALAPALAMVAVAVLVLVPWTIRNEVRLHTFAPVSTSAGTTLAGTYNPTTAADKKYPVLWIAPYEDPGLAKILLSRPHPSEVWVDHQMTDAAVRYMKAHPTYFFRVMYWNTVSLFDLQGTNRAVEIAPFVPYSVRLAKIAVYSSYVLELLAIVGLFLPLGRKAPKAVWLIPVTTWLGIIILSASNIRYRGSIEPFTVLLASVTITAAIDRLGWFPRDRRGTVVEGAASG